MAIFAGKRAVKFQYQEIAYNGAGGSNTFVQKGATDLAHSILIASLTAGGTKVYFDNTLDVRVIVYVVNALADEEKPGDASNKIFLLKVPADRVLNLDQLIPDAGVEGGTQFWVYAESAPSRGYFTLTYWG